MTEYKRNVDTARGFRWFVEFRDSYGARVAVTESSAMVCEGEEPGYCWIFIEGGGITGNKGSAHLTDEQVREVRDALTRYLESR